MRKPARIILIIIGLAFALASTGCPKRKTIAELQADPGRYQNEEITIAGRVTQSFGAFGRGIYEIDDGTGRMWVLATEYGVPSDGVEVAATGRITLGVTFAGRNYGTVLRETKKRKYR